MNLDGITLPRTADLARKTTPQYFRWGKVVRIVERL
jgi:hypothetical protein